MLKTDEGCFAASVEGSKQTLPTAAITAGTRRNGSIINREESEEASTRHPQSQQEQQQRQQQSEDEQTFFPHKRFQFFRGDGVWTMMCAIVKRITVADEEGKVLADLRNTFATRYTAAYAVRIYAFALLLAPIYIYIYICVFA